MPWPDAYCLHGYAATGYVATGYAATGYPATGYVATCLRAISMTTLTTKRERVPDYQEGARSATFITRALAKFGEVDSVPVSENSLKYNTFC